jgi:hypothetical protein
MQKRLRAVVTRVLSNTKLSREKQRTCTEEVIFIISRVMQLRGISGLRKCPDLSELFLKPGVLDYGISQLEKNPSVEDLRQILHYVFQAASRCICFAELTKLRPDELTHIGHIMIAMEEAYPDFPLMSSDAEKNCRKLQILQRWKSERLHFCPDIVANQGSDDGRMMKAIYEDFSDE